MTGMTPLGRALKAAYMIRLYRDGYGHGFIWRWWNPLTWVVVPFVVLLVILIQGVPETLRHPHEIGFGIHPYFIENPDRLEWIP